MLTFTSACLAKACHVLKHIFFTDMEIEVNYVNSRGHAYRCRHCTTKDYVGDLGLARSHFYKHHVTLGENPFYCVLCGFRCEGQKKLENHIRGYATHQKKKSAVEDRTIPDERYLRKIVAPRFFKNERDTFEFDRPTSNAYWKKRLEPKTVPRLQPTEAVVVAEKEVAVSLCPEMDRWVKDNLLSPEDHQAPSLPDERFRDVFADDACTGSCQANSYACQWYVRREEVARGEGGGRRWPGAKEEEG